MTLSKNETRPAAPVEYRADLNPPEPQEEKKRRVDDVVIKAAAIVLVVSILTFAVAVPDGTAAAIGAARTFVTEYFTWFFVAFSALALGVCGWLAFGRFRHIRLGGPDAKPQYGKFAWYSMLFACGQGIGLIFWSVAEPIMLKDENPLFPAGSASPVDGAMAWSYFHWGLTAWAMYCIVAICLAYSHHNLGKKLTFRDAVVDIFPRKSRRGAGMVIELLAILATVLGLSTSFGFATLQFTSGISAITGIHASAPLWIAIIVALGVLTAGSVFFGISKGMKRISEINSVLSIVLLVAVLPANIHAAQTGVTLGGAAGTIVSVPHSEPRRTDFIRGGVRRAMAHDSATRHVSVSSQCSTSAMSCCCAPRASWITVIC